MTAIRWIFPFWLFPVLAFGDEAAPTAISLGSTFAAADTLACGIEPSEDAKECLDKLAWKPTTFTVKLEATESSHGDYLVRFPSPRPIGNSTNDLVAMEWFAARNVKGAVCKARAIVVVHESARSMTVGRMIARNLNGQGFHTFLIHLPGYGARRHIGEPAASNQILAKMQQGISDVRRARDAAAALPVVNRSVVGLQGTSLGGFVVATVAGLDRGYDRVFILLAGGNVHEVVLNGSRDAAKVHQKLLSAGLTDDQIKEMARQIDPLRLAHRINPGGTWLYTGAFDSVVPRRCSLALAKAANLPKDHHIEFLADHYLGIIYLPQAVQQISQRMREVPNNRATQ